MTESNLAAEPAAKTKLIQSAAKLVYQQGWHATGLNQILGEAGVPKGSFYYYFHSKDDLGVAIVKFQMRQIQESYRRTLLNPDLPGDVAIRSFFDEQLAVQRESEWRYGCPVGAFSNEVAASIEKIAAACREALEQGTEAFATTIARGQRDGTIAAKEDAATMAINLMSAWQGALLCSKTFRDERPFLLFLDAAYRSLFHNIK